MNASAKKRVLVASIALIMVVSAVAVLFNPAQNNGKATADQNQNYLAGSVPPGNEPAIQQAKQVANAVINALQTYTVTFTSIGYQSGLSWSVTVDGTNTISTTQATITFQLSNGSHAYSVTNHPNYMANPANGVVMVYGTPVTQYITFSLVEYNLVFVESGLPVGTSWSVNLSGDIRTTTMDSILYNVDNGTYGYTLIGPSNYIPHPESGSVVVYGENNSVNVNFISALHEITFNFSGEVTGTTWELNLAGDIYTVSGNSLSVLKPNGLYNYSISTGSEYWASPSSGSVLVLDSDSALNVALHIKTYTVTFEHVGMTAGTPWEITLGGVSQNSTSSKITFEIPAGNYTYEVTGADGYSAVSNSGYVNVLSESQQVSVNFNKNPDYLTGALLLTVGAAIGIAAGIGIGLYVIRRK